MFFRDFIPLGIANLKLSAYDIGELTVAELTKAIELSSEKEIMEVKLLWHAMLNALTNTHPNRKKNAKFIELFDESKSKTVKTVEEAEAERRLIFNQEVATI